MKIKAIDTNITLDIPTKDEVKVLEFLEITKLRLHAKQMFADNLISADDYYISMISKFVPIERKVTELLFSQQHDRASFASHYWELYEN
jgi:hypothetical protein